MDEARQLWRECIADAGISGVGSPGSARERIQNRWHDLSFGAIRQDGTREEFKVDPADLAKIQRDEIAIATADNECRVEHYNDVLAEVSHELEAEFVADHREELEQFRDYLIESFGEDAVTGGSS